jgi:thymidylate synthase (FAD)
MITEPPSLTKTNSDVKLISITKPVIKNINSSEELITFCARVSNPENQYNKETSARLLNYLIRHKHWSPFEMVSMTVEIKTSRAIAAQILRHRSFSFQEFSQRYSSATAIKPFELRKQGKTNRQVGDEPVDISEHLELMHKIEKLQNDSLCLYSELLSSGIAKESARMVLPLSTSTSMYMTGTIRSWIHYIDLRSGQDTQKEHRKIAVEIKEIFVNNFPDISKALEWN